MRCADTHPGAGRKVLEAARANQAGVVEAGVEIRKLLPQDGDVALQPLRPVAVGRGRPSVHCGRGGRGGGAGRGRGEGTRASERKPKVDLGGLFPYIHRYVS